MPISKCKFENDIYPELSKSVGSLDKNKFEDPNTVRSVLNTLKKYNAISQEVYDEITTKNDKMKLFSKNISRLLKKVKKNELNFAFGTLLGLISEMGTFVALEKENFKNIKYSIEIREGNKTLSEIDFIAEKNGKTYIIEVKSMREEFFKTIVVWTYTAIYGKDFFALEKVKKDENNLNKKMIYFKRYVEENDIKNPVYVLAIDYRMYDYLMAFFETYRYILKDYSNSLFVQIFERLDLIGINEIWAIDFKKGKIIKREKIEDIIKRYTPRTIHAKVTKVTKVGIS